MNYSYNFTPTSGQTWLPTIPELPEPKTPDLKESEKITLAARRAFSYDLDRKTDDDEKSNFPSVTDPGDVIVDLQEADNPFSPCSDTCSNLANSVLNANPSSQNPWPLPPPYPAPQLNGDTVFPPSALSFNPTPFPTVSPPVKPPPQIKAPNGETYTIGKHLGSGAYGRVYEATNSNGKKFAIKFFDDNSYREWEKECRNLSNIKGAPHTISMVKSFITKFEIEQMKTNAEGKEYLDTVRLPYAIVMPLLPSENKSTLSCRETIRFAKQILESLNYTHKKGNLIHSDLTKRNVHVDNRLDTTVYDFGLSQPIGHYDPTQLITCRWERDASLFVQIAGCFSTRKNKKTGENIIFLDYSKLKFKYGPEVDLWSFACLVHEIYTGKPLFPSRLNDDHFGSPAEHLGLIDSKLKIAENGMPVWKNDMIEAAYKKGESMLHAELICSIIEPFLKSPDQRLSAEQALEQIPALKLDIHFTISSDLFAPETLSLYDAEEYNRGIKNPIFQRDMSMWDNYDKCLHVKLAKNYVYEFSDGRSSGTILIKDGDEIHFDYDYFQSAYVPVTRRTAVS